MYVKILIIVTLVFQAGCLTTRSQMKKQESEKRIQTDIQSLREQKADYEMRLSEVDNQFRDYNGRIELLENKISQMEQEKIKEKEANTLNEELLNNKFKLLEEAIVKLESELGALKNQVASTKKTSSSSSDNEKRGNYSQAEVDFSKKKWKEAIVGYQKYRDLNPKGKKYADSTYKIGVCFMELGMKSEAKAFFQEVLEKYPKSRFAQKSQYRLKKLK